LLVLPVAACHIQLLLGEVRTGIALYCDLSDPATASRVAALEARPSDPDDKSDDKSDSDTSKGDKSDDGTSDGGMSEASIGDKSDKLSEDARSERAMFSGSEDSDAPDFGTSVARSI
jgi:hypothetical protein